MERKNQPGEIPEVKDRRIQWKKLNGGFFRMPNRIIKQNQLFWATPEEIPLAFRDTIVPVHPEELQGVSPEGPPAEKIPAVESEYAIEELEDGTFNIVDNNKKAVNEKPMKSRKRAEELLKTWKG